MYFGNETLSVIEKRNLLEEEEDGNLIFIFLH